MTHAVNTILETLLQLSDADRGEVAARLLESLDAGIDEGAELERSEEIRTRIEDARTGKVKTVPWAAARKQIMDDSDGGS